jgi:glycerophosphoryl diester phosphodiesterase
MYEYVSIIIACYSLISYCTFRKPNLISKKKQWNSPLINKALQKKGILHFAHRGGSRERLENTIEAFQNGLN